MSAMVCGSVVKAQDRPGNRKGAGMWNVITKQKGKALR